MRLITLLLALASIATASGTLSGEVTGVAEYTLPETNDLLDSYAFNQAEQMSGIGVSFGDYAVVDDFTADYPVGNSISSYTCWGVTQAMTPTNLVVLVVADASGPDGAPTSADSYPCTVTESGFLYGGYVIWVAEVDLSENPIHIPSGITVWLGSYRNSSSPYNWYPLCGTTTTGMNAYRTLDAGWAWEDISVSLEAGDLFKIIKGFGCSLERTSWAAIKSAF